MATLREQMQRDLQLRGLSPKTQRAYLDKARDFAHYFKQAPDQLGEEEIREYLHYLLAERRVSETLITLGKDPKHLGARIRALLLTCKSRRYSKDSANSFTAKNGSSTTSHPSAAMKGRGLKLHRLYAAALFNLLLSEISALRNTPTSSDHMPSERSLNVTRLPALLPKYLFLCIVLSKGGCWHMPETTRFDYT